MNALFGNLTTDGMEEVEDRLGGGFQPFDTGSYISTIKQMYAGESQGGAKNMTIIADIDGKEHRETIYFTNKKGENFFLNKQDNSKKVPLPGFTTVDDICLVATGIPLAETVFEEKMVKIWDHESRKEVPKSVPVAVDCIGKQVGLALLNIIANKSEKQGNEYVDIADTRSFNEIDKVFDPETRLTVVEARNEVTEADFMQKWEEKNSGNVRDKRSIKDGQGGSTGRPGASNSSSPPQGGAAKERKSLFGNKAAA